LVRGFVTLLSSALVGTEVLSGEEAAGVEEALSAVVELETVESKTEIRTTNPMKIPKHHAKNLVNAPVNR
jgi:hypothetical protein